MVPIEAIVAGMNYAVLALLVGVLVSAGFLLPNGEPRALKRKLLATGGYLIIAFLIVAGVSLVIQGAKLRQGNRPSLDVLFCYLTMTQSGKIWLLREVYAVALAAVLFWFARSTTSLKATRWIFFLALPLVASRSFTSHAVAVRQDTMVAMAADAGHLIATGLWGGGLLALFWILYRSVRQLTLSLSWVAETVHRFSRLALGSVAALVITGLYQSWIQVGDLKTLFSTDYGRVLLLKLALFIPMLGFGALNYLATGPGLLRAARGNTHDLSAARKALRRVGAESFLALLVFFVTGLLTVLPPGVHAVHQAAVATGAPIAAAGGQSATTLSPAEGASIEIISPTAEQVFKGDRVPLRFKMTKGKRGHHVHAYVDGELMGMFESRQGTLNGIKPGRHVLELRVVAEDHQTELDASDRITFVVK
jgi:putative copper resistance protein D